MNYYYQSNNTLAWISVIISIVAMIFAVLAYSRTAVDIDDLVENQVNEASRGLQADIEQLETDVRNTNIATST